MAEKDQERKALQALLLANTQQDQYIATQALSLEGQINFLLTEMH